MASIQNQFRIVFVLLLQVCFFSALAQKVVPQNDTLSNVEKIEEYLSLGPEKSKEVFYENTIRRKQKVVFDAIEKEIQNADFILKTGLDYKSFTQELATIIRLKKKAIDGVINNRNDFQTIRNITVTTVMLKELQIRIDKQMANIQNNNAALTLVQNKIDSLTLDESIYVVPKDTVIKVLYYNKFKSMSQETALINKKFKDAFDSIAKLEVKGNQLKFSLQNDIIEIDNIRKDEFTHLFSTSDDIFVRDPGEKTFYESFVYSFEKEMISLLFFISNHIDAISLMVLFVICIIVYLLFLRNKYQSAGIYNKIEHSKQIFRHPIASALLISFTLFNFFFIFPPFAFTAFIWMISIFALTFVNREVNNNNEKRIWRVYAILLLLGFYDNNILIHSVVEVYFILFLALTTLFFSWFSFIKSKMVLSNLYKCTLYVVIGFELLSVVFILLGNYSLGKLLMVNGLITVLMCYLFTNTYKLIILVINYSKYLSETDEEKKIDIRTIEEVNHSSFIIFIFVLGWIVSIGKNSYLFQLIVDPFADFFTTNRSLGDITYTYSSIFIFFLILIISVFLAKIVSFLSSSHSISSTGVKGNQLGSWLLLIQIVIFTIGIIIAFASAGIPIDRLTIIISALGVGIGFGLQALVNNLVSGLIIAFEKPVNIGDIIEVGSQMGKMKSIGIRSSVVTTFDGADVIIPNGDLLNQHLTNWTLGNNKRRVEIAVGVAYGTDLENAKQLLLDVVEKHSLILSRPAPIVWVTNFNDSSIDFAVKFWVANVDYANDVRSDMFIAIDTIFKENNIEIPFPQQDVYIKKVVTDSQFKTTEESKE
ncbi:mechanosensitive ion channel domain-containing protein [Flavobacterium adhaerens]|uniref:mechanosensitive ion channel domain-containing protein n=1 Tax=Flavobacterium adhaerens TaxID=3149043 RepID=UPI0032B57DD6